VLYGDVWFIGPGVRYDSSRHQNAIVAPQSELPMTDGPAMLMPHVDLSTKTNADSEESNTAESASQADQGVALTPVSKTELPETLALDAVSRCSTSKQAADGKEKAAQGGLGGTGGDGGANEKFDAAE
jgi:hypothetical protein